MSRSDLKKIAEVYKKGQEMMREIGVIIKTRNFCFCFFSCKNTIYFQYLFLSLYYYCHYVNAIAKKYTF